MKAPQRIEPMQPADAAIARAIADTMVPMVKAGFLVGGALDLPTGGITGLIAHAFGMAMYQAGCDLDLFPKDRLPDLEVVAEQFLHNILEGLRHALHNSSMGETKQ